MERSRAFAFLSDIKERFQNTYGQRAQTALPYAMNSDFSIVLATQMVNFFIPILDSFFITFSDFLRKLI